ncbi:MAG: ATP-binding protein [Candidatus Omnitrophota bacterium]|nr:ATP-binding protein [Candidatus Omnitrophota bacterium]
MPLNPFAVSNLLTDVIFPITVTLVLRYSGREKIHHKFVLFYMTVVIWAFGLFMASISKYSSEALLWWKIAHIGGLFVSVTFLQFVCVLCNVHHPFVIFLGYLNGILWQILSFLNLTDLTTVHFMNSFYILRPISYKYITSFSIWLIPMAFGFFEILRCHRTSVGNFKNQLVYIFVGMFFGFFGSMWLILAILGVEIYPYGNFGLPLSGLFFSYAILKHQLMDINIVIKKGLVYSVLVAFVTSGYLIFVITIGRIFQGLVGYQSFFVNLFAIFAIALLFNPLRNRIQSFLDKRFFKGTLESLSKEKERLQHELFQTEKLAYVGGLASSIVHEIKNPLTAIKTFLAYLPQKYQEPDFKAKFENLIPQEIKRIENVVNQLLGIAKPQQPTFKPVNIVNIIDSTLSLLENNLKLKGINVKKDYQAGEATINGDEEQLRQVFLNLFLNSIQAMNEGGVLSISTSIEHRASSIEKSVLICVKDNGCGISQENLNKLFTPFFTTKKEGVGLGLAITQEIIKQHKGEISVESNIGEGTNFIIELSLG